MTCFQVNWITSGMSKRKAMSAVSTVPLPPSQRLPFQVTSESDTRVHYSKTDWSGPSMSIFGDVSLLSLRTTESVVGALERQPDCNHRIPYPVLGTGLDEGISPAFHAWDLKLGY